MRVTLLGRLLLGLRGRALGRRRTLRWRGLFLLAQALKGTAPLSIRAVRHSRASTASRPCRYHIRVTASVSADPLIFLLIPASSKSQHLIQASKLASKISTRKWDWIRGRIIWTIQAVSTTATSCSIRLVGTPKQTCTPIRHEQLTEWATTYQNPSTSNPSWTLTADWKPISRSTIFTSETRKKTGKRCWMRDTSCLWSSRIMGRPAPTTWTKWLSWERASELDEASWVWASEKREQGGNGMWEWGVLAIESEWVSCFPTHCP